MKRPKRVFSSFKNYFATCGTVLFLGIVLFLSSCENNIDEINALLNPLDLPELEAHDMKITRTDSGKIIFVAIAPLVLQYNNDMRRYIEFPEGINVYSFDNYPDTSSRMKADYAKFYSERKMWEAKGNVEAENDMSEKIMTEQIFWDQNKGQMYSESFTTIITEDGIFYGKNGFESDDTFKRWKLVNTEGIVNVKDE
ncbi:MAG: LPS export ABC transporter periplasmic protein LptC [Bacteroidetes bacterium HGW-Bacteroidetes-21]|jgi:LPS export ABC transporter protein LptC|nr:MAG: LPS export ABC transporter periplasmic protein LptC [Bacteroidetes bacterium HGW-Bacteroidetes-21]